MKNKFRILKILITLILFGFLLSFSLKRFNGRSLEKITIKMNASTPVYFVDEKEVKDLVKKENPTLKIGDLNIPLLEKKLNRMPAVDSANVYLNLNGNLNLDIKQRVPIFRIINGDNDFYVDQKGVEFPISRNYSHPCMLVTGEIKKSEYVKLADLISKIDSDSFSKKFFIGISKNKESYSLLTSDGFYRVELGDLDNIDFKVKGFKAFVTKFLVNEDPDKYSQISLKYDNQIVTTLNPHFEANDSILAANYKEFSKIPAVVKMPSTTAKKLPEKSVSKPKVKAAEKPREKPKVATPVKKVKTATTVKKPTTVAKKKVVAAKPKEAPKKTKAKIKIE
ncbi:cell division protein FtsQ/DivIB [Halpernia frigidisoli]|uniref:Cell division protein FtsQ n=1 Tax=Halpernia frigidisoli TaxID=1125876 RepID=A0A1I3GSV6_9FLAO|nr:cell division protein FtsQ [Halpernia frigidisoli]SFI26625.1 cell division protein FtsQ [Halpernia frigidisoli]